MLLISKTFKQKKANKKIGEPGHEKMCLMPYVNNKGADQPEQPRSLMSAFVFAA